MSVFERYQIKYRIGELVHDEEEIFKEDSFRKCRTSLILDLPEENILEYLED